MYETLVYWENVPDLAQQPPVIQDFARIWQAAEKVVYSRTLAQERNALRSDCRLTACGPGTRTRIERAFDLELVRQVKNPMPEGRACERASATQVLD